MGLKPLALTGYRLAWEPALWVVRAAAVLENLAGGNLWPARWRLRDRLQGPSEGKAASAAPTLWLHAASLGECKGLWACAQSLRDLPVDFLLTANTVEALRFLTEKIGDDERWRAALAPLDHPRVVREFLRRQNVRALVLFEMELWPHFILETGRAAKPVLWISARLTARAARRYGNVSGALRAVLNAISWTQAQSAAEAESLRRLGCRAVETGADLRGLHALRASLAEPEAPIPWERRAGVAWISLHADELPAIVPALAGTRGDYPVFIFPRRAREIGAFRKALEPLGFRLRSREPRAARQIVDAFGLVEATLKQCRAAVIGGSFAPHGGHNLWEPLAAGTRMVIGPHHESQAYLADKLAAAGLARVASRPPDPDALHEEGEDPGPACRDFIRMERERLQKSLAAVIRVMRSQIAL